MDPLRDKKVIVSVMTNRFRQVNTTNEEIFSREALVWWQGRSMGAVERIASLGYGGLIAPPTELTPLEGGDLALWAYIKAPECSPTDKDYRAQIEERLKNLTKGITGLFWESPTSGRLFDRDQTRYDLLIQELRIVEEAVGDRPLIFYPSIEAPAEAQRLAGWLKDLLIDGAQGTSFAFSYTAGSPTADQLPLHPFWEQLADSKSHAPLFPILNIGEVEQGECLWPTYTADVVEEATRRMTASCFKGVIAIAPALPLPGCVLDANLSVASKAIRTGNSSFLLLEEWMRDQGLQPQDECRLAGRVRSVQLALRRLLSNEGSGHVLDAEPQRVRVQSLLYQLNELALDSSSKKGSVAELLPTFVRDAKRLLYQYMQANTISLPNVFSGEDMQESFWTSMSGGEGRGVCFGSSASMLLEPRKGAPGSVMERIYSLTYSVEVSGEGKK
jgi:hypothetical protein